MVLWPSGQKGYIESNHLEDVESFGLCFLVFSLLLTPLCCNDIRDVTPHVSALAGCDNADMDLLAFIQVADPTKVKVGERERAEGEAKLLDSTVWHVVLLLPVTSARVDSELEASVDRLFDEGGSADQGDSAAGCGQETKTELVTGVMIVTDENLA
ncbi:hypothetical protein Tco_0545440 [Tanacetum coccineum]